MADPVVTQIAAGSSSLATTTVSFTAQAAGTLLLLSVASDDYRVGSPSGWTLITDQHTYHGHAVWYKLASGSETSVPYVIGSAARSAYLLLAATNIDQTTPYITGSGQFRQSSGNTYTTPSMTPAGTRVLAVGWIGASNGGSLLTAPGSWTNSYTADGTGLSTSAPGLATSAASLSLNGGVATSTGATFTGITPEAETGIIAGFKVAASGGNTPATVSAPIWTSTAAMLAPTVAGGSLPVPATVTPTTGTASATALAPSVTGLRAATVNAPLASASAAMPPPTVRGLGGAVVAPSAMTAISAALAPTVTGNRVAVVQAPAATAGALAPTPTVTGLRAAVVNAVTALANAVMNAPAIITGGQAVVQAPLMGATATTPPPSVIGFKMATVMAPTGTATAVMPAPTYSLYLEALVRPALGSASAEWAPPAVSVGVYITAPIIAATAALLAPSVTNGSHVSTTPDGELVAYLIPSNRVDARLIERVDRVVAYLIPRRTGP